MKDRLTKKRVKVDYEAIIKLLDLSYAFRCYQYKHGFHHISLRRQMYNFLRTQNVDFEYCSIALKHGCVVMADLVNYCGSYKAAMEYCHVM